MVESLESNQDQQPPNLPNAEPGNDWLLWTLKKMMIGCSSSQKIRTEECGASVAAALSPNGKRCQNAFYRLVGCTAAKSIAARHFFSKIPSVPWGRAYCSFG
jgi:hypothetical protein